MSNLALNGEVCKDQTIGVEIEMGRILKEDAARIVALYFEEVYGIPVQVWYNNRHHHDWCCYGKPDRNGNPRKWSFMDDGSAPGPDGRITCEMVTPILRYEDIKDLQEIVRRLRQAGAKSGAGYNAGVHIHIGADFDTAGGQNARSIRNLVNLIKSHERLICDAVSVTPDRQRQWAHFVEPDFLEAINTKKPKTRDELGALWYGSEREYRYVLTHHDECHYHGSRYHLLNLHAIWDKGTIEFRCFEFHKNLHAGELKAWIQLCLAMCSYAKLVRNCRVLSLQDDNQKYAMYSWLKNMGLMSDEYKTCRKMLTKHLRGDTAYRNGRRSVVDDIDDYAVDFMF